MKAVTAMVIDESLTEHIIQLREKVARMESDVAHLTHGQDVHSGSMARTDSRLAHIATSLRDAHVLIRRIQQDVDSLGRKPTPLTLGSHLRDLLPAIGPASFGILILLLTLLGKSDLAAKLAAVKP